jgi:hypothetical protein
MALLEKHRILELTNITNQLTLNNRIQGTGYWLLQLNIDN